MSPVKMRVFLGLYRLLLRCAPRAFRETYAAEMTTMVAARVAERRGLRRVLRALVELGDLGRTILHERRRGRPRRAEGMWLAGWLADARMAWTSLRRRPTSVLAGVSFLALGLGAGTLGFGVLSSVLVRPLPYGNPAGLVFVWGYVPHLQAGFPEVPIHGLRLVVYRKAITGATSLEGFKADVFNVDTGNGAGERVNGLLTTAGLFDTLQVRPALGRFFAAGEDAVGAPCRAVIGYGLWRRRFGGDPAVVNRVVRLNDRACTVIGVAPAGFDFPRGGEMPAGFQYPTRTELWVAAPPPSSGPSDLTVLARLAPGTTPAALQTEFDAVARNMDEEEPRSRGWNGVRIVPLAAQVVPRSVAFTVAALFAAMAMLLLVAAGNATQLFVVRSIARRTDFAIRAALGAGPARLIRAAVMESAAVTAAAALVAAGLAEAGARLVRGFGPDRFPRLVETTIDWRAMLFLAGAAVTAAALTAIGPVALARRVGRDAGLLRGRPRGAGDPLRRARGTLVFVQVALAVVLVTGSGLLVRSLLARMATDPGFRPDHALTFEITLPPDRFPETLRGAIPASRPEIIAALDAVLAHLRALPGVEAAAMGKPLPMSGASEASVFAAERFPQPTNANDVPLAEYIVVSDGFFRAMGTPIVEGREFTRADREHSEGVAIVNEALARQLAVAGPVIGQRLKLGGVKTSPAPWLTIVGIAKDMKRYALDDDPGPTMYVTYTQGAYPSLQTLPFVVRTSMDDPMRLLPDVRHAIGAAGLDVPVAQAQTLEAIVAHVSADARFATGLMVALAATALLLAVAGLYGTVAFAVSQRMPELGVRAALGARPGQLMRLVVLEGAGPAVAGAVVGLAGAVAGARFLQGLLFGISPADPLTLAAVPVFLAAVVAVACLVPARRAASADPRETLRSA